MQQQDYIERLIAQIASAIARILGFSKGGNPEDAERELAATWSNVLGLRRSDIDRLDGATLRALLGGKRFAAADLLDAEAEMKRLSGDTAYATRLSALASALRR